jgi:HlyD family secretion protein
MNLMKKIIILILILLLAAIIVGVFLIPSKKNSQELILYGNVDVRQVEISFRVPGQITSLLFEEGDVVGKGSLMAELDKSPYDSQVRQARSNVKNIQANFDNAEILLKRRQELVDEGGVSQEDLNNAFSSYTQLLAQLNAAQEALNIALDNLKYTETYAPTEGVLLTRIREPGSVVNASDPVYTLSISSPIWIRAFVDEVHLGQVYYGMQAEISTDTPNGHAYLGKVGFISPVAEFTPKTVETTQLRTDLVYRLRIYVDHPDSGLRQGMPVTVKLNLNQHSIPKNE